MRTKPKQRGNTILEFAVLAPVLIILLGGTFTIGMSLVKAIQVGQVCRNANVLCVRGVDLSRLENQKLIVKTAMGLGLNVPNTYNPDPNGKAVVILTRVIRVGPNACNAGIPTWDQNPATCPNYGAYVIAWRIAFGNTTRWRSPTGDPASMPASDGKIPESEVATNTGNRATGFPGIISLSLDEFAYISEVFADISELKLFTNVAPPIVAMRNIS